MLIIRAIAAEVLGESTHVASEFGGLLPCGTRLQECREECRVREWHCSGAGALLDFPRRIPKYLLCLWCAARRERHFCRELRQRQRQ